MKTLDEMQQRLDTIRRRVDKDDKAVDYFEIEPSRKGDMDRDFKIKDNKYVLVESERGKIYNTREFESADELVYHFTTVGIASMVNHSGLGLGRMTIERLDEIRLAKLELMKQAMPEWVPRYKELLDKQHLRTVEIRERLNGQTPDASE